MTVEALPGSLPAGAVATESAIAERRMRYRVVLASILGNGLEWFGFVAYAAAVLSIVVVASTYRRVRQPEA